MGELATHHEESSNSSLKEYPFTGRKDGRNYMIQVYTPPKDGEHRLFYGLNSPFQPYIDKVQQAFLESFTHYNDRVWFERIMGEDGVMDKGEVGVLITNDGNEVVGFGMHNLITTEAGLVVYTPGIGMRPVAEGQGLAGASYDAVIKQIDPVAFVADTKRDEVIAMAQRTAGDRYTIYPEVLNGEKQHPPEAVVEFLNAALRISNPLAPLANNRMIRTSSGPQADLPTGRNPIFNGLKPENEYLCYMAVSRSIQQRLVPAAPQR